MLRHFDVALWLRWPEPLPEYVGHMQAPHASEAVEGLMCIHGLVFVASACALYSSLIYRCHKPLIEIEKEVCS